MVGADLERSARRAHPAAVRPAARGARGAREGRRRRVRRRRSTRCCSAGPTRARSGWRARRSATSGWRCRGVSPGTSRARPVRPRGRHRVAADVVQRAHPGGGAARSPARSSEPERPGTVDEDEPVAEEVAPAAIEGPPVVDPELVSPMDGLVAGATFGSLVHAVLEHADPQASDLRAELRRCVEEERRWWSVPATSEQLADALLPMQHTPLGPLAGDLTLADLGRRDRLCELDFELPMAGGDLAAGSVPGRLLADVAFGAAPTPRCRRPGAGRTPTVSTTPRSATRCCAAT